MRSLHSVCLASSTLLFLGIVALAAPARATEAEVSATLSYVSGLPGSEIFRYDYTVRNLNVTPTINTFIVFFDSDPATQVFDGSDDADFVSAVGPTAAWVPTAIEGPDPDAWYVEFANWTTLGPAPGEDVATFSVEFLWTNENTLPPCEQFFEVLNGRAHEGVTATKVVSVSPRNGTITGLVLGCDGGPIAGVTVDLFQNDNLVMSALTNLSGVYTFSPVGPGSYTVNVVTPIGYTIEDELPNAYSCCEQNLLNFRLECQQTEYDPRTIGFWKHQANVHITGKGKAQVTKTQLISYLDLIYGHFAQHPIHPVLVYTLPPATLDPVKLTTAQDILTVSGGASMELRARQQLMALLLNVASGKLSQSLAISADGATVSQAITYAWDLIADGDPATDEIAKTIADELNNGRTLAEGIITGSTPIILYSRPGDVVPPVQALAYRLGQNYPNPVNLATRIPFAIPAGSEGSAVQVQVFDMSGRLVKTLVNDSMTAGEHEAAWDGLDDSGRPVAAGVYFYRLSAGSFSSTRKLQVLN